MTWQVWFQSDFNFSASIHQLEKAPITGDISQTHPGIYYFSFNDSKQIRYEITTKSKLSISYQGKYENYSIYLERVQPFLVREDASLPNIKISKILKNGKEIQLERIKLDAEPIEVSECLSKIKTTANSDVLNSRLTQLQALAANKNISHYPEVLDTLELSFGNPLVIQDIENFRLVIDTLIIIFYSESDRVDKDKSAILKIKNEISVKLVSLLKSKSLEFLRYSLSLLENSEKEEVVDLIFEKIENDPLKALDGVVDTLSRYYARALAKLYSAHKILINHYLDKMIDSGDVTKIKVGKELRNNIVNQNLY